MSEAHIKLAARLYDARTALKSLWGEEYAAKIEAPMEVLKKLAEAQGVSVIEAAMKEAKHSADNYLVGQALVMLAAAVEILEPSK